tara:strand:+ start:16265 stop:17311 length:1047 start_codon:yes stop_codon:yes gene_type:complete
MLEQAVIDAKSLKEAAVKTAEDELLKKYSSQIKEAVNALLEQDEVPLVQEEQPAIDEPVEEEKVVQKLELKALDGEPNSELSEEELVEINLDELKEEIEAAIKVKEGTKKGQVRKDPSRPTDPFAYEDEPEDEVGDQVFEEELEEEIELSQESITRAIEEILTVDYENVPRGDLGTTHPTREQHKYALDATLAAAQSTEEKEKDKVLNKALEEMNEQLKSIKLEKNKINEDYKRLKKTALTAAQKLEELNFSNTKLLYQNRILRSSSLNERQKKHLVETISNANSINDAKIIFETLNQGIERKASKAPQNLSEVTSKNNQLILKSNNASISSSSQEAAFRMKKLAGII